MEKCKSGIAVLLPIVLYLDYKLLLSSEKLYGLTMAPPTFSIGSQFSSGCWSALFTQINIYQHLHGPLLSSDAVTDIPGPYKCVEIHLVFRTL